VLEPQQLLRAHARGDVPGDAAVAHEASAVEHRLTARADVTHLAVRIHAPVNEIGKRLPRLEHGLVPFPASVVATEMHWIGQAENTLFLKLPPAK